MTDYNRIIAEVAEARDKEENAKKKEVETQMEEHRLEIRKALWPLLEILEQAEKSKLVYVFGISCFTYTNQIILPEFKSMLSRAADCRRWKLSLVTNKNQGYYRALVGPEDELVLYTDIPEGSNYKHFRCKIKDITTLIPELISILADMSRTRQ